MRKKWHSRDFDAHTDAMLRRIAQVRGEVEKQSIPEHADVFCGEFIEIKGEKRIIRHRIKKNQDNGVLD